MLRAMERACDGAITSSELFRVLGEITPFERAARQSRDALQTAREQAGDKTIISLRDRLEDVARRAELVLRDAQNNLDYLVARQAEAQARASDAMARASHRLNVIMAIFLPLTALGSMLGMNMTTGLEAGPAWVFRVVLAGSLLAGVALTRLVVRA